MKKETSVFDFNQYYKNIKNDNKKKDTKHADSKQKLISELNKISIRGANITKTAQKMGKSNGEIIYKYRLLVNNDIIPEGKEITDEAMKLIECMFGSKGPMEEMKEAIANDPNIVDDIKHSYSNASKKTKKQEATKENDQHEIKIDKTILETMMNDIIGIQMAQLNLTEKILDKITYIAGASEDTVLTLEELQSTITEYAHVISKQKKKGLTRIFS